MAEQTSPEPGQQAAVTEIGVMLHHRGYLMLVLFAALLGIPLSVIAFGFLAAVHQLEDLVWHTIPEEMGYHTAPGWWAILVLALAGIVVGLVVAHAPGRGGHVPALGFSAGAAPARNLPGIVLAAGASLVLGAVIGPEAPLMAIGSGLALLAVQRTRVASDPTATAMIAATGSAAALSSIFGNPLVAAVLLLEVLGLARRQTMLVILPCLVSSGIGALIFTGLGDWTGLGIGALSIPDLPVEQLDAGDLLWSLPIAVCVAIGTWATFLVGQRTAAFAKQRPFATTLVAGLITGCSAAIYTLITDHTPTDVVMSGQATLATLGTRPDDWTTGALVLLLVCKGIAYAVCLGAFRGGPAFPAIFLGGAFGILASTLLPGVGSVAGLAIGMAAGVAVTRLLVTSVLLVTLLLGEAATDLMPAVILAAVIALIVDEMLTSRQTRPATDPLPA